MQRKILSITGSRSDWGLMRPVHDALVSDNRFEVEIAITGMHLLPNFSSSLDLIHAEFHGKLHFTRPPTRGDGKVMAVNIGHMTIDLANIMHTSRPDIILLQGDRGEMLAAALAAAHMNLPIVHMSGGDYSGSIDDSIRNAISKMAHVHLTTCDMSTARLMAMDEDPSRIFQVGEPGLDAIRCMQFIDYGSLVHGFGFDSGEPVLLVTQHPVTTEANHAGEQMRIVLEAILALDMQAVVTHPNTDAGSEDMLKVLHAYRGYDRLFIVENLGMRRYLSLMRGVAAVVGNSSSGILEAPYFKTPVINIGTRQHGRQRACNIIDVACRSEDIVAAVNKALNDEIFRTGLEKCVNPYGDGHATERVLYVLDRLRLTPGLLEKWMESSAPILKL